MSNTFLTVDQINSQLQTIMDPELNVDIVSLGLIYDIKITYPPGQSSAEGDQLAMASDRPSVADQPLTASDRALIAPQIYILMTLTTPGCPLVGVIDKMIKDTLAASLGVDTATQLEIELTFDPPWTPDMMSEAAKITLGFE